MTGGRTEPDFTGLRELFKVIHELCARPGFFYRSNTEEVVGDQPLPLLYLESAGSPTPFLRALEARLDAGSPKIPHAYVDVAATVPPEADGSEHTREPGPLLPLLDQLRVQLARVHVGSERLTRFDHYRLVDWLTRTPLPDLPGRDDRAAAVELLRSWTGRVSEDGEQVNRTAEHVNQTVQTLSPGFLSRLVLGLVTQFGAKIGISWLGKRVPGLARESKWFMRGQNYALPNHSIDFLGFAERLTLGRHESENTEQIHLLLVHAFLEDLRIAYRRKSGRFRLRRAGWRRTAYVPVLLDGVTRDNGGWELLKLINKVRNDTGELDPLLVIAASDDEDRLSRELSKGGTVVPVAPHEAEEALATWREELPRKRQLLADDARYLVIALPRETAEKPPRGALSFKAPPVRWLAKSRRLEAIIAVLVLLLLVPAFTAVRDNVKANCSLVGAAVSSGVSTRLIDEECVGYSDNASQIFGSNPRLKWTQQQVFQQNEEAEKLHADDAKRPLVTLVYFSSLTNQGSNPDADHSRAEELEGMLLKQRQQNIKLPSEPLLRIVIANGGTKMKHAHRVLGEMLTPLLTRDPSIIGVIGLDRSVADTKTVISELGGLGVPTIGTTLTEASLPDSSATYFQLIPGNVRQAELVRKYAQYLGTTKVTIYHPPQSGSDIYTSNLVTQLGSELAKHGIAPTDAEWVNSPQEFPSQCTEDRSGEMVFFAGREENFAEFLRAIGRGCPDRARMPRVVADDAIIRFVAQKDSREQAALAGMRLSYVSMAGLIVLAGKSCVEGEPDQAKVPGGQPLDVFCRGYNTLAEQIQGNPELPEKDRPAKPWPGEHLGVAYDATGLFLDAVRKAQTRPGTQPGREPHRAAVGAEFRELNSYGATGRTNFSASRVGEHRNFMILEIADIHDFEQQPVCVFMIGEMYGPERSPAPNGCPV